MKHFFLQRQSRSVYVFCIQSLIQIWEISTDQVKKVQVASKSCETFAESWEAFLKVPFS